MPRVSEGSPKNEVMVTTRLPAEVAEALTELAARRGLTRATLLRVIAMRLIDEVGT